MKNPELNVFVDITAWPWKRWFRRPWESEHWPAYEDFIGHRIWRLNVLCLSLGAEFWWEESHAG